MQTQTLNKRKTWLLLVGLGLALIALGLGEIKTQARPAPPAPQTASPPNPLTNPGFEGGAGHTPCAKYDANGNLVEWVNPNEITTPDGWTTFFKNDDGAGLAQPEVKPILNQPPYDDPPRVHSGEQAVLLFTFYKIHDAGFYQQVSVTPGSRWRLSAWVHGWTSCYDDPHVSYCNVWDPYQAWQVVGIDPTGGTNPYAPTVAWSAPVHVYDVYTQTNPVEVTAQSDTVTVFIRSWVKWAIKHNDMYWDEVSLEQISAPHQVHLPILARNGDFDAQTPPPTPIPTPTPPPPSGQEAEFGVVFVNPAEPRMPVDEGRYQKADDLGIGWDRWPLYWYNVELEAGQFDWAPYDEIVEADLSHGLNVNPILLGTPGFYATGGLNVAAPGLGPHAQTDGPAAISMSPPAGLYQPVFADGTDLPGSGKAINPDNPWARFVYRAVERYRPGGLLAAQNDWPADWGLSVWEVWNEPDLALFWSGNVADYARLLKVAALAARQADPEATVMVGGLANPPAPGYLADLLTQLSHDPNPGLRDQQGWYFDAVALHNYGWSWQTGERLRQARQTLDAYQSAQPSFDRKDLWLNESGVPVWNDYPGPTWQGNGQADNMATMEEQSAFVVQNATHALYRGAKVIFHFQLYDGCGNDPAGTDFPPDRPDLCDQGLICASASAFGLWRNQPSDSCYRQHPQPDTARPLNDAFETVVQVLSSAQPVSHQRPDGEYERFTFYRPDTQERITVLWTLYHRQATAEVPAVADQARLIKQTGASTTIYPVEGVYSLSLPAATNLNAPHPPDGTASIGGRPYILVEDWPEP